MASERKPLAASQQLFPPGKDKETKTTFELADLPPLIPLTEVKEMPIAIEGSFKTYRDRISAYTTMTEEHAEKYNCNDYTAIAYWSNMIFEACTEAYSPHVIPAIVLELIASTNELFGVKAIDFNRRVLEFLTTSNMITLDPADRKIFDLYIDTYRWAAARQWGVGTREAASSAAFFAKAVFNLIQRPFDKSAAATLPLPFQAMKGTLKLPEPRNLIKLKDHHLRIPTSKRDEVRHEIVEMLSASNPGERDQDRRYPNGPKLPNAEAAADEFMRFLDSRLQKTAEPSIRYR